MPSSDDDGRGAPPVPRPTPREQPRAPEERRRARRRVLRRVGREVVVVGPPLVWAVLFTLPLAPVDPTPGVLELLPVAAVVPVLLLRRRAPLAVGAAAALLLLTGAGMWLTALVALLSAAVRSSPRTALLVGLMLFAGHVVGGWPQDAVDRGPTELLLTGGFLALAGAPVLAATTGVGLYLGARRQLLASAQERAERAEAEQARQAQWARERERTRIAREMHDVLAHRLSMLALHAGALEYRADAVGGEVAQAAGVVRDNAHQALQELRDVLGVLRAGSPTDPSGATDPTDVTGATGAGTGSGAEDDERALRPQPSLPQVGELVAEAAAVGDAVDLHLDGDVGLVPPTVGRAVYRVVQEGLTNARKHAPGSRVSTWVTVRPDVVSVEVRNTAPPVPRTTGAGPVPGSGTGLVGVAERAVLLGGRAESGATADGGYALAVRLPLPAADRARPA